MFRVQGVTVPPAVFPPQVVVVKLRGHLITIGLFRGKRLPVDCAIFGLHFGNLGPRFEFGRHGRAIVLRDHESGQKLDEQLLLHGVAQAVMIGVDLRLRAAPRLLREQRVTAQS